MEKYIAFDMIWQYLQYSIGYISIFYFIFHCINYLIHNTAKWEKRLMKSKYIIKELTTAVSSILYTLLVTAFLLYITFISKYTANIAKDNNITTGIEGIQFTIKLALPKKEIEKE